jgi:hypothetical protein
MLIEQRHPYMQRNKCVWAHTHPDVSSQKDILEWNFPCVQKGMSSYIPIQILPHLKADNTAGQGEM